MDEAAPEREPLLSLLEDYLSGQIDEARLQELEARLRDDPEARREFVRYARLHTDLHFELRAREASERVLDAIDREAELPTASADAPLHRHGFLRRRALALSGIAAGLLVAIAIGWWALRARSQSEVAWLVNAQDCTWADGEVPTDLRPGKVLVIDRGLAEFQFQCGARVILEGPAQLELVSGTSARLHRGKLTARATGTSGFEILSPQGKVIDLGTEFGVAVSEQGATSVRVFEGSVEVLPSGAPQTAAVSVAQNHAAQIARGQVTVTHAADAEPVRFIRSIVPGPVPVARPLKLTFDQVATTGLRDATGQFTGLTHRLPGTGYELPDHDPNLRLDTAKGQLELTTTETDLNTRHRLWEGEYLGVRLADLGFTGSEDFSVSTTFLDIPALQSVGQFGVYAGSRNDKNIRGGLISSHREEGQYRQFLVNNRGGNDANLSIVGLLTTGTDLRVTLRRTDGRYTLMVENLTAGTASTLTTRHPQFLDGERDIYVGVFGANTQSKVQRTLIIKEFQVIVWTVSPPNP